MASIVKRESKRGVRYDVRTRIAGRVVTRTFATRKAADAYASTTEADKLRGVVVDPRRARVTVQSYSDRWLEQRPDLAERTRELYRWLLDKNVLPRLGAMSLAELSPSIVRTWHSSIAAEHPTTAAKAYRLLSSIMRTAVSDEVIVRNPCQVKGAASEHAPERPTASVAEVDALGTAMPDHLRAAVLLAAWCQLRRAELLGLRRRDIDLLRGTLTISSTRTMTMAHRTVEKEPKTAAGRRTVAIPTNILAALTTHLDENVGSDPEALMFGATPQALDAAWRTARRAVGRPELRLHDLRHSGLTWSAATGATIAELMHRAGHASPVAALRYQHATEDRDQALAAALAQLAPVSEVVPIRARDGRAMEASQRERSPGTKGR
ncbi:MAG TPA: tyrosine-type recombinase/integrase [Acidimicrobiales bacterium]|nr:tyrosine-type recombinase/integrase [Acidimicrobiales bacterium]